MGEFVGLQAIGDAHFVELGVGGEREQAGMLIFTKRPTPVFPVTSAIRT